MQAALGVARALAMDYARPTRSGPDPARRFRPFHRRPDRQQWEHRAHDGCAAGGRAARTPDAGRNRAAGPHPAGGAVDPEAEAPAPGPPAATFGAHLAGGPAGLLRLRSPSRRAGAAAGTLGRTLAAAITALQDMPTTRRPPWTAGQSTAQGPGSWRTPASVRTTPGQPHRHRRPHSARCEGCAPQRERMITTTTKGSRFWPSAVRPAR